MSDLLVTLCAMTWTGAVGAISGLVGAIGVPASISLAARQVRLAVEQRDRDEDKERWRRAQGVSVRVETREQPIVDGPATHYRTPVAVVANDGPDPIFRISVLWKCGEELYEGRQEGSLSAVQSLRPGMEYVESAPVGLLHRDSSVPVTAKVWFVDSASRTYARQPNGHMETLFSRVHDLPDRTPATRPRRHRSRLRHLPVG